jgi:hypothetical protein
MIRFFQVYKFANNANTGEQTSNDDLDRIRNLDNNLIFADQRKSSGRRYCHRNHGNADDQPRANPF